MNLKLLTVQFREDEIEWRLDQCGKTNDGKIWGRCFAYVSARAIMDRLDDVCGPEKWKVSYDFIGDKGVLCVLSIKVGDEWVAKIDGAEPTDFEAFKGGISSALKRAGNVWGLGRYLYNLESGFIQIVERNVKGARYGKTKEGTVFYWVPPQLPEWALPLKKKPEMPPSNSALGAQNAILKPKAEPEDPNSFGNFGR